MSLVYRAVCVHPPSLPVTSSFSSSSLSITSPRRLLLPMPIPDCKAGGKNEPPSLPFSSSISCFAMGLCSSCPLLVESSFPPPSQEARTCLGQLDRFKWLRFPFRICIFGGVLYLKSPPYSGVIKVLFDIFFLKFYGSLHICVFYLSETNLCIWCEVGI